MATQFGYSVCVADIQVTWRDGRTQDCLKKTYQVTKSLGIAFAGSVRIGFELVEDLQTRCSLNKHLRNPASLMSYWPRCARRIFEQSPGIEKEQKSELLIFGLNSQGERMQPVIYKLRSPDFKPRKASGNEVLSIGCGSAVEPYAAVLRDISNQPNPLARWETHGFAGRGIGIGLMMVMFEELQKRKTEGISYHLLCSGWTPHEFWEEPNNGNVTTVYGDCDKQTVWERRMPDLVTSYKEFEAVSQSVGFTAAGAVC